MEIKLAFSVSPAASRLEYLSPTSITSTVRLATTGNGSTAFGDVRNRGEASTSTVNNTVNPVSNTQVPHNFASNTKNYVITATNNDDELNTGYPICSTRLTFQYDAHSCRLLSSWSSYH